MPDQQLHRKPQSGQFVPDPAKDPENRRILELIVQAINERHPRERQPR